jgi:hypothetical protein
VDCTHRGGAGTREFNVGGPANGVNYRSALTDVPWEELNPGDTVRVHWRAEPYAEKLLLFRSGTADKPIRVCGVLGGPNSDQRPTITGINAKTRATQAFRAAAPGSAIEPYGLIVITGAEWGEVVEYLTIENLRFGQTKLADSVTEAKFTNMNGGESIYSEAAACVRMRQAHNITLRANEIFDCGDGLFAASQTDADSHMIRNLLVEGNYLHGSGVINDVSRHQAYLQGVDITVQSNYFGPTREMGNQSAGGNQLKMRAAGIVVRYNYFENGARTLDLVEAEEHAAFIMPWQYKRLRVQYLACKQEGCLKLNDAQLAQYDARHAQDWAKYQAAYVYGNLFHVWGRYTGGHKVPTNLVHYGFDNSQHDRQPGVIWFYHNTVLYETDRDNMDEVRLFDYFGSDFGDGGYYKYPPNLKNVGGELHYITLDNDDKTCQQLEAGCTDWGPMLQTDDPNQFGRMRAFNNVLVLKNFSNDAQGKEREMSEFQLTRRKADQLELSGKNWITQGWDVDRDPNDGAGGGYGRGNLQAVNAYPGANDKHHVTGVQQSVITGQQVPIDVKTFAPTANGGLAGAAAPWDARLDATLQPQFSVTRDASQPGRLQLAPRQAWSTLGASQ